MKKLIFTFAIFFIGALSVNAQTKKDGTPDMRYSANKQTYGNSYLSPGYSAPKSNYSTPSYSTPKTTERNYDNGGQVKVQNGYQKSNGTYVAPHFKTTPDNIKYNNLKPKY
jgi:hypothetical protein